MQRAILLSDANMAPWAKFEFREATLVPRPTWAVVGLGSPFAVVVRVCRV